MRGALQGTRRRRSQCHRQNDGKDEYLADKTHVSWLSPCLLDLHGRASIRQSATVPRTLPAYLCLYWSDNGSSLRQIKCVQRLSDSSRWSPGHQVAALVRNQDKLVEIFGRPLPHSLPVIVGDIDESAKLAGAMAGHDVVINAAGYVTEGATFTRLVQIAIDAATATLGQGGRFWQFGGAAVLDVPGTGMKVYEAHRTNLISREARSIGRCCVRAR